MVYTTAAPLSIPIIKHGLRLIGPPVDPTPGPPPPPEAAPPPPRPASFEKGSYVKFNDPWFYRIRGLNPNLIFKVERVGRKTNTYTISYDTNVAGGAPTNIIGVPGKNLEQYRPPAAPRPPRRRTRSQTKDLRRMAVQVMTDRGELPRALTLTNRVLRDASRPKPYFIESLRGRAHLPCLGEAAACVGYGNPDGNPPPLCINCRRIKNLWEVAAAHLGQHVAEYNAPLAFMRAAPLNDRLQHVETLERATGIINGKYPLGVHRLPTVSGTRVSKAHMTIAAAAGHPRYIFIAGHMRPPAAAAGGFAGRARWGVRRPRIVRLTLPVPTTESFVDGDDGIQKRRWRVESFNDFHWGVPRSRNQLIHHVFNPAQLFEFPALLFDGEHHAGIVAAPQSQKLYFMVGEPWRLIKTNYSGAGRRHLTLLPVVNRDLLGQRGPAAMGWLRNEFSCGGLSVSEVGNAITVYTSNGRRMAHALDHAFLRRVVPERRNTGVYAIRLDRDRGFLQTMQVRPVLVAETGGAFPHNGVTAVDANWPRLENQEVEITSGGNRQQLGKWLQWLPASAADPDRAKVQIGVAAGTDTNIKNVDLNALPNWRLIHMKRRLTSAVKLRSIAPRVAQRRDQTYVDVAVDPGDGGNVYTIDTVGLQVFKKRNFNVTNANDHRQRTPIAYVGSRPGHRGDGNNQFKNARAVCVSAKCVYVVDHDNRRVQVFSKLSPQQQRGRGVNDVSLEALRLAAADSDEPLTCPVANAHMQVYGNTITYKRTINMPPVSQVMPNASGPTRLHPIEIDIDAANGELYVLCKVRRHIPPYESNHILVGYLLPDDESDHR